MYHFMNNETFEQIGLSGEVLGRRRAVPHARTSSSRSRCTRIARSGIELPLNRGDEGDRDRARDQGRLGLERRQARQDGDGPRGPGAGLHQRGRRASGSTPRRGSYVERVNSRDRTYAPRPYGLRPGWIEVITGSMFSGKSEELIRRVRRAQIARQKVQLFKPQARRALSRGRDRQPLRDEDALAGRWSSRRDPAAVAADTEVVGIDEGQFFDASLVEVVDAAREPRPPRDRGRPRPGLPRTARSSRCRSSWPSPSTSTRRSPSACVRGSGQPLAAPRARRGPGGGGRRRPVRGALSPVLPPRRRRRPSSDRWTSSRSTGRRARAGGRSCARRSPCRR